MNAFVLIFLVLLAAAPQDHGPTPPRLTLAQKNEVKSHRRYHAYLVTLNRSYVWNRYEPGVEEFVFDKIIVMKVGEMPKPPEAYLPHATTIKYLHLKVEDVIIFQDDRPTVLTVYNTGVMGDFLLSIWDSEENLVVWPPTQRGSAQ